jgi:hypothetical protein
MNQYFVKARAHHQYIPLYMACESKTLSFAEKPGIEAECVSAVEYMHGHAQVCAKQHN